MATIKLPQASFSEAPRTGRRDSQTEQILRVLGNNPYAVGIESAGNDITDALARRSKMKQEVQQAALFARAGGLEEDTGITSPALIDKLLDLKDKQEARAAAAALVEAKSNDDSYSPEELNAIFSGIPGALPRAYKGRRIPQNALSLFSTVQNRQALDQDRDESRHLREIVEGTRADDRATNRYRNYILDMEQRDPVIKEFNKQKIGLDQVDGLVNVINTGNTIAANALGAKVARAMGEVGVMTDTDVVRYVQSGKLTQGAADKLLKMATGIPTNATLGEIKEIANVLKDNFEDRIQPRYDQYISSYSSIEGDSPEAFSDKIKIRYSGKKAAEGKKATMRWNPQTGKVEPIQ